jgi:hypothetical protein
MTNGSADVVPLPTGQDKRLNVLDALGATIRSAINLRVITLVGDAPITGSVESPNVSMPAQAVSMVTNINLVEGDVSTLVSQAFLGGQYAELRTLHAAMTEQAQKIIERNVAILQAIVKTVEGDLPLPERRPKG